MQQSARVLLVFVRLSVLISMAFPAVSAAKAKAPIKKVQLPGTREPRQPPAILTPEDQKGPDRQTIRKNGLFQLDFEGVAIDKLAQTISDMTGKLFIIPDNIRGKITIIGPEHGKSGVTAKEAYAAFLASLDANGLTVYRAGKFYKIVQKRDGKQSNIPTVLEQNAPYTHNEQMITKLFRLQYIEAEPIRSVVQQLASKDGDAIAFPPDMLIVNDTGLNMHRLERIIAQLDSASTSDEIRVIQINYASANDMADKLSQIFDDKNPKNNTANRSGRTVRSRSNRTPTPTSNSGDSASLSKIIADERTNKLIVIANDRAFQRIQDILKQLDSPMPGEGSVRVYYLKNANAEEMASTLASLTQGTGAKSQRTRTRTRTSASSGQTAVASLFSGEVKITADKGSNSLVIVASNADYKNLIKVIERLDLPRRQVFIEAVIMEVNLDNNLNYGVSVHGGKEATVQNKTSLLYGGSEVAGSSLLGPNLLASFGGFLAGLQGPLLSEINSNFPRVPAFSIVLQALQNSSNVNVLSTPHILASDNEEAAITVGENVPVQAGISTPASIASTLTGTKDLNSVLGTLGNYAPIQRQNIGLELKIKPQINESDFIRLEIQEQTEEITSNDPTLGPTTSKKTAKTTVVAKDQQTVVIGGMIKEKAIRGVKKVPLLGDIPVLGWLFRSTTEEKTKSNLLLFLTPYIIRDPSDFRRIFERKMKERQQFVEQFYGRKPGYQVPIDYSRKIGPLAKMIKTISLDSKKIENGGPGGVDERLIAPQDGDEQNSAGPIAPETPEVMPPQPPPESLPENDHLPIPELPPDIESGSKYQPEVN